MFYYLLIFISVLMTAGSFCVSKKYQLTVGSSRKAAAYYSFAGSVITFLIFWVWSGFSVAIPPFSLMTALGATVCGQLYTFIGFRLMSYGRYAIYITYLMTGGMMLPFLYGLIFLGEPIRPLRVAGLLCLTVIVILLNSNGKGDKDKADDKDTCPKAVYTLLCLAVFLLNGGVSIFSKVHQVAEDVERLSTLPYAALSALLAALICGVWFLIETLREKKGGSANADATATPDSRKLLAFTPWLILVAAVGGVSTFLQLTSAAHVDASILYPMMTGGTIVISALVGRFVFGEKQSKKDVILTALCFASTLLFVEF